MTAMQHPRYAVVGSLTIDSVATAAGELIPRTCGGNSLYGSIGAHIWDPSVGLVTRAGRDYPDACLGEISGSVDTSGVRRLERDHPVRVAFAYKDDGSRLRHLPAEMMAAMPAEMRPYFVDNTRETDTYFAGSPTPDDIPRDWLAATPAVHLPPLLIKSHVALVDALRTALPTRLLTVDSPWHETVGGATLEHLDLLQRIDVTMPSEADLRELLPDMPIVDAALWLVDQGAHAVVIKIGPHGSLVVDGSRVLTHVPAYPADAVDPTGAGDSFCGGFLVGLHETGDLIQAALYGTVAASFVVEDRHATPVFAISRDAAEGRLRTMLERPKRGVTRDPREEPA
jgi:sugar/nucleoside kinase (ribokinase family)